MFAHKRTAVVALLAPCLLALAPAWAPARDERVAYLAGGLGDDDLVVLSAHLAAGGGNAVLLVDTLAAAEPLRRFLEAFAPERVVPVGTFDDPAGLEKRLGRPTAPVRPWKDLAALRAELFPRAPRVVVCAGGSRRLLLQAACLAGTAGAPLLTAPADTADDARLAARLKAWETREVLVAGKPDRLTLPRGLKRLDLPTEAEVAAEHLKRLRGQGPPSALAALVLANPADPGDKGGMSALAPWVALRTRGVLLLTNDAGDNANTIVRDALNIHALRRVDALVLAAHPRAIPVDRRPNPIEGKDPFIEMEPMTPTGEEPFSFATGRLFHQDRGIASLVLARERLLDKGPAPRRALVASNPGDSLPLLEMFSRHTAREMQSRGYDTTALFQEGVDKDLLRKVMPQQDIFLWEGHHKTMVEDFGMPKWTEPLRPALVVLQSCLALNEEEVKPLFVRGALGVVGSSTRTYSGSGGAFTLSFFDALMYEDQTLGGALRQAKNFLLAYSILKQKRLGADAKLAGANIRSAWAFSLWGDPTLRLPAPDPRPDAPPAVRHEVRSQGLTVTLPEEKYDKIVSEKFQTRMWPNGRLAGLLTADEEGDERNLIPLVFVEVRLPRAVDGQTPRLKGRLAARNWVFTWDARRKVGYLLIRPPSRDEREFRFSVSYTEAEAPVPVP